MVASDTPDHNFFRRPIRTRTTVARTCFSPVTGAATSSLPCSTCPCSTSSPWRGSPVSTRGRGPPEALARAPVWRHNSSGRRPRLPSCVRNSASRMPAWLRSQPTGARTTRPPSAWPSWNCGPHADARRHAAACGLTIRMSAQSFRAAVLVRPRHEILMRKNVASPS